MYLGWSSTKSDGLRRPDVGLHHICLHQTPRPTTTHGEDSGVRSWHEQSGRAGSFTGGCLPRIFLEHVQHLQQSNGTTRSALLEALRGGLTIVLNPGADAAAGTVSFGS